MSETQEKLTLEVATAEHVSETKSGWHRWNIVDAEGGTHRVTLQPDVKYTPKTGDTVTFFKGSFNSWVLDRDSVGISRTPSRGSSSTSNDSSDKKMGREDYWRSKDQRDQEWRDYQETQRDPKIEFQTYFNNVTSFYAAAIPTLKKPPSTVQELDGYIDDAFFKAEAIFARIKKEDAKKK